MIQKSTGESFPGPSSSVGSWPSRLVPQAIAGICLLYAVLSMNQLFSGRLDNFQTYGVHDTQTIVLPGDTSYLEYTLPSMLDEFDDVTLFISEKSRLDNRGNKLRLEVEVEGSTVTTRTVIFGQPNPNYREYNGITGDPAALSFYHLNTSRPDTGASQIKLRISLEDDGELEFYAQPRQPEGKDGRLTIGGEEVSNLDIGIQIRELDSRRLWRLFLFGSILLVLSITIIPRAGTLPAVLILVGFPMSLILAEFSWQFRMDAYWNYFWPDGYVGLTHQIRLWLSGDSGWNQLSGYLSSYRNGQSWLVPLLVALVSVTGASYLLAFTLVIYFAGLILLLTWLGLFRRLLPLASPLNQGLFALTIMFHYLHVLTGGTPMNDIGASAFVALFYYTYYPLLSDTGGSRLRNIVIPGIVLALACQTRVALLPLMLTPLSAALVLLVMDKVRFGRVADSDWHKYAAIAAPSVISAVLLLAFYILLNLFGTFQLAKIVATSEIFQSGFNPGDFFDFTVNICLPGLLATAIFWRKVISSPLIISMWIFIIGYLAMLYLGQIITWERYWAPVAGASVFTALGVLAYARDNRLYTGAAVVLIGAQLYFIFHNNLDLL